MSTAFDDCRTPLDVLKKTRAKVARRRHYADEEASAARGRDRDIADSQRHECSVLVNMLDEAIGVLEKNAEQAQEAEGTDAAVYSFAGCKTPVDVLKKLRGRERTRAVLARATNTEYGRGRADAYAAAAALTTRAISAVEALPETPANETPYPGSWSDLVDGYQALTDRWAALHAAAGLAQAEPPRIWQPTSYGEQYTGPALDEIHLPWWPRHGIDTVILDKWLPHLKPDGQVVIPTRNGRF